jgi:hypothetical protein
MSNRKYRDNVTNALNIFEENGGKVIEKITMKNLFSYDIIF